MKVKSYYKIFLKIEDKNIRKYTMLLGNASLHLNKLHKMTKDIIVLLNINIENNEISSHEHLICDECGKCTDAECNGEKTDKCLGHTPKHEHVACPECGLCINSECDKEENKCLGHTPKHEHIACQDCGKCISESCDSLKEERCQGCIKICLTNKTYVSHLDLDIDSPKYYIIDTYEEFIKFVNENSLMEIQFGEYHGAINVDYYNDLYFHMYYRI